MLEIGLDRMDDVELGLANQLSRLPHWLQAFVVVVILALFFLVMTWLDPKLYPFGS